MAGVLELLYRGSYAYPDPIRRLFARKPVVTTSLGGEVARSSSPAQEPIGATDEHVETARGRLARFDPTVNSFGQALLAHARVYNLAQSGSIVRLLSGAETSLCHPLVPLWACPASHSIPHIHRHVSRVLHVQRHIRAQCTRHTHFPFIAWNFLNSTPTLGRLLDEGRLRMMDVMMCLRTRLAAPAPADSIAGAPSGYVSELLVGSSCSWAADRLSNRTPYLVISQGYKRDTPHDDPRDLHGGTATPNHPNQSDRYVHFPSTPGTPHTNEHTPA